MSTWPLDLDPSLNEPKALLARIMKRPKPIYRLKARQELTKQERLETRLRKPRCVVECSLHDNLSRFSSLPVGHPIAYGKFIMDKYIKAQNTLKRYLSANFPIFIPYFPKRLTLDKKEDILSLRLRDLLS